MPRSPDPQTVQPHRQPRVRLHALQLRVRRQRSRTKRYGITARWSSGTSPNLRMTVASRVSPVAGSPLQLRRWLSRKRLGLREKRDGGVSLEGAGRLRACRGDPWRGRSEFCQCLRRSSSHTNLASTTGPSLSRTWMDIKANGWLLLLLRTISASERAASTWAASTCGSSIPSSSGTNSSPSRMSKKYRVITLEIRDGRRLFRRGFGKDQASVDLTGPATKR